MAKIDTMHEVDRLKTIQAVIDGKLMSLLTAARLHLCRPSSTRRTGHGAKMNMCLSYGPVQTKPNHQSRSMNATTPAARRSLRSKPLREDLPPDRDGCFDPVLMFEGI